MPEQAAAKQPHTIEVHVVFPLAPGGPFNERVPADTTAGRVRADAMARFGVADDPQYAYYLTRDVA
jgi:hypothetical protein